MSNVAPADWLEFVAWSTRGYPFDYLVDGVASELPTELSTLVARSTSQLLRIKIEGVHLHCHFFGGDSIELDIDPNEVRGPRQHLAVLDFMSSLAFRFERTVLLCPENGIAHPILRFAPDTRLWEASLAESSTDHRDQQGE